MNKKVAIDSGKYATKALTVDSRGIEKRISFRTKMDITTEIESPSKESFVISFKDKNYIIGEKAESIDYDKSKAKVIHKIAIMVAVSQLVDNKDTVNLAVGCPIDIFQNTKERKAFEKYLAEDKELNFEVNGVPFSFTIGNIKVLPESSGFVIKNILEYKNKLVGIIDIGGLNVNGGIYDKGFIKDSSCFTLNKGANIMTNELKLFLNQKFNSNIQDLQMEYVIDNGFIKKDVENSKKEISEFLQNYVHGIIKEAKKKNWDLDNLDLVFIGGGSLLLKKEIKNIINDAEISKNAMWDNAEGFHLVIEQ